MFNDRNIQCAMRFNRFTVSMIPFLIYVLTLGLFAGCTHCQSQSNSSDVLRRNSSLPFETTEGWEYRWGDSPFNKDHVPVWTYEDNDDSQWKPIDYSEGVVNPPDRGDHKILWLRVPLPDKTWRDPQILLKSIRFACEVYLESKLLYRFKSVNVPGQGKFTEDPFHLFPINTDFQKRDLYFRIYSEDTSFIGFEKMTIGSHVDILNLLIEESAMGLIFGFLFISTGIIPLILFITKRKKKAYFVFATLCLSIGLWSVTGTRMDQYFFNAPRLWFYLTVSLPFLTAVTLCAYFEQIFGAGYKSILRRLWQFFLVYLIVAMFLIYTTLLPLGTLLSILMIFYAFFGVAILILFGTSLRAALRRNTEAKIITIGFAALSVFGIYDILGGIFQLVPWSQNTYQWGMFFFIVSLGFALERRFQQYAIELEKSNIRLQEYSQTLEEKVEERTRELREAQNQLIMREKMASLGNLVAGVAHEVNTPIGAVHSAADVTKRCIDKIKSVLTSSRDLDEVKSNKQFQNSIEILEDNNKVTITASERIAKIVRSLRTFARLDEAEYQKADIHEGLDSTLTLVEHEMKDRITVVKDYGEIPEMHCYLNQLNQVFMNVLMNAIQAIEEKGTITIKTYLQDTDVIVKISDNGCGISPENIDKIFNPGFTTRGVGVGTGLGLSISYNIIEKHRGKIKVESEVGKGSTFTVALPIETEDV